MTEWAGLEIRKAACPLRGFESLSLRKSYVSGKQTEYRNSNELRYFLLYTPSDMSEGTQPHLIESPRSAVFLTLLEW